MESSAKRAKRGLTPPSLPRGVSEVSVASDTSLLAADSDENTLPEYESSYRSHDERLPLKYATESWAGRKDDNEDRYVENVTLGQLGRFFGIFDGHAGAHCAEFVAKSLSSNIQGSFRWFQTLSNPKKSHEYSTALAELKDCTEQLASVKAALAEAPDEESLKDIDSQLTTLFELLQEQLASASELDIGYQQAVLKSIHDGYKCTEKNFIGNAIKKKMMGGSTALTIIVNGDGPYNAHMAIANLGDCRAVLCRRGQPIRLTEDHKPDRKDEEKRIKQAGGRVLKIHGIARATTSEDDRSHPGQPMLLAVSRSFGDYTLKTPKPIVSFVPEITIEHITHDDAFVMIGCDGIFDVLSDEDVVSIIKKHYGKPQEAAATVVRQAHMKGSNDNLTATVIEFAWNEFDFETGQDADGAPPLDGAEPAAEADQENKDIDDMFG